MNNKKDDDKKDKCEEISSTSASTVKLLGITREIAASFDEWNKKFCVSYKSNIDFATPNPDDVKTYLKCN